MFGLGVCAAVEEEPDAQGRLGRRVGGLDEHLPAHPEMGQDSVARVEREPEILAAAVCGADRAAGEGRDEAGRTAGVTAYRAGVQRSEEHTSELQSLMRISYAVFCLKQKKSRKQEQET